MTFGRKEIDIAETEMLQGLMAIREEFCISIQPLRGARTLALLHMHSFKRSQPLKHFSKDLGAQR
jgi:S-adenosylhomocysteine hydrolase